MENVKPTEADQTKLFFYKVKDEEKGPYTYEQLDTMWKAGQISAVALYRSANSAEWRPLGVLFSQQPDDQTKAIIQSVRRRSAFVEKIGSLRWCRQAAAGVILVIGLITLGSGIFCDKEKLRQDLARQNDALYGDQMKSYGASATHMAGEAAVDIFGEVEKTIQGRIEFGILLILVAGATWALWATILGGLPYIRWMGWLALFFCLCVIWQMVTDLIEGHLMGKLPTEIILLVVAGGIVWFNIWRTKRMVSKYKDTVAALS